MCVCVCVCVCQAFIEDSVGDRVWVDLEQCRRLVDNICITFQTKTASSSSSSGPQPSGGGDGGGASSGKLGSGGETAVSAAAGAGEREDSEALQALVDSVDVEPRYFSVFISLFSLLALFVPLPLLSLFLSLSLTHSLTHSPTHPHTQFLPGYLQVSEGPHSAADIRHILPSPSPSRHRLSQPAQVPGLCGRVL